MNKLDLEETRVDRHTSFAPYAYGLSNWARNKYHHERCFPAPHVLKILPCLQAGGKTNGRRDSCMKVKSSKRIISPKCAGWHCLQGLRI